MARNLRTLSVRLDDDDVRALRELRAALVEASGDGRRYWRADAPPELRLLSDVRGHHAPYDGVSDSQTVRWAVRYALDRFQAPRLTDPPAS
jgi:hypothetical protein